MKKNTKRLPLIATSMAPAAAITSALVSPTALGASGELDPSFGDVGRLGPILDGPAWSLEPQSDDTILLGGGGTGYFYWGTWYGGSGFVRQLSDTGDIDSAFAALNITARHIADVTRQSDGQVIAVGRRFASSELDTRLIVTRLRPDGTRDPDFGVNGEFELSSPVQGSRHDATSVALEPDGRIVVSGSRDQKLIVLRLLSDGSLDQSFAEAGVFEGPANLDYSDGLSGARTNLLRTGTGGYRVTATGPEGCQVIALTADGAIDGAFGNAGIATVVASSEPTLYCSDMDAHPDGRLLVAGTGNGQGFAARLLANGQPDSTFAAGDVAAATTRTTAIAADGNEAVVVAGVGDNGMSIRRLVADGGPDPAFGNAGTTTFDLDTNGPTNPVVNDLFVGTDRKIVGAGGVCLPDDCWWSDRAFVFRLLGDVGSSPGVLGISEQLPINAVEGEGEVVVTVRRTGGKSGSVSVAWETSGGGLVAAMPGQDFTAGSGILTWADGDAAEQQIHVPILPDDTVEAPEYFEVLLSEPQNGAGLGKRSVLVAIAPDGDPYGQFGFPEESVFARSERVPVTLMVSRDYYSSGMVSVTLTPVSGSATAGEDFAADPITVTWQDGETGWKEAQIPIVDDDLRENNESFTVELSNPTGGALIGPQSSVVVVIPRNDQPRVASATNGNGGGAIGVLSLLALGFLRLLRRVRLIGRMS